MKKAFTLLELLVAIALVSTFAVTVLWLFSTGLKTWGFGYNRARLRQDVSAAMQRMVRELSQTNSISSAQDDQITFLADLDDNGTDETVAYALSGADLQRTEGTVVSVLAFDVQTFGLTYRDLDDNLLNPPGDTSTQTKRDRIRVVTVSLTMDKDDETVSLSSSVFARNQ